MTELELTREVMALATKAGVLSHHCLDSRHCQGDRGLPDLILAGPGGLALVELKTETGESYANQDNWLWTAGLHVMTTIWRPADLETGRIRTGLEMLT